MKSGRDQMVIDPRSVRFTKKRIVECYDEQGTPSVKRWLGKFSGKNAVSYMALKL